MIKSILSAIFTIWKIQSRAIIVSIVKDAAIRFAVAILRDRIATDLASIGYIKDNKGIWRVDREKILPGDPNVTSVVHEADAIRSLVETVLARAYPLTEPPKIEVGTSIVDKAKLKAFAQFASS